MKSPFLIKKDTMSDTLASSVTLSSTLTKGPKGTTAKSNSNVKTKKHSKSNFIDNFEIHKYLKEMKLSLQIKIENDNKEEKIKKTNEFVELATNKSLTDRAHKQHRNIEDQVFIRISSSPEKCKVKRYSKDKKVVKYDSPKKLWKDTNLAFKEEKIKKREISFKNIHITKSYEKSALNKLCKDEIENKSMLKRTNDNKSTDNATASSSDNVNIDNELNNYRFNIWKMKYHGEIDQTNLESEFCRNLKLININFNKKAKSSSNRIDYIMIKKNVFDKNKKKNSSVNKRISDHSQDKDSLSRMCFIRQDKKVKTEGFKVTDEKNIKSIINKDTSLLSNGQFHNNLRKLLKFYDMNDKRTISTSKHRSKRKKSRKTVIGDLTKILILEAK